MIDAREDHLMQAYNFDFQKYYSEGIGWVVTGHEIAYVKPAFYNEIVNIRSTLFHLDESLLQIEIIMMNQKQNQIKSLLWSSLVPVDLKTGKKIIHPIDFMDWAINIINTDLDNSVSFNKRLNELILNSKSIL
jgi:acyl-CoA thioester hydrolase